MALEKIHADLQLMNYGLEPVERFIETFQKANLKVWDWFDEDKVTSANLREKRIRLVFDAFQIPFKPIPGFHEAYKIQCSGGKHLMPGSRELLEGLKEEGFSLHIITNGFEESQIPKMVNGEINSFFSTVTTSDRAGAKKPDFEFFRFALQQAKAHPLESLVVGDGLRTDVAGAQAFGLPVVWYNPLGLEKQDAGLWEIRHLKDLWNFITD